jgi:hypothetical protein
VLPRWASFIYRERLPVNIFSIEQFHCSFRLGIRHFYKPEAARVAGVLIAYYFGAVHRSMLSE